MPTRCCASLNCTGVTAPLSNIIERLEQASHLLEEQPALNASRNRVGFWRIPDGSEKMHVRVLDFDEMRR